MPSGWGAALFAQAIRELSAVEWIFLAGFPPNGTVKGSVPLSSCTVRRPSAVAA
jgi:hypothetical protein